VKPKGGKMVAEPVEVVLAGKVFFGYFF